MKIEIEMHDSIEEAKKKVEFAVEAALEKLGQEAEAKAKQLATDQKIIGTPESTGIPGYMGGTFRNSIAYATSKHHGTTIKVTKANADPHKANHGGAKEAFSAPEKTLILGSNVFYAPFLELGTSKMKARPTIKPAIQSAADNLEDTLREFLKVLE